MQQKKMNRRDLIKQSGKVALGGMIMLNSPFPGWANSKAAKTKVVLVRDKNVIDEKEKVNADAMQTMLDKAMLELTAKESVAKAWESILSKEDIVGIKTNVWRHLSTPHELEQAIKSNVLNTGVDETNISINDRGVRTDPVFLKATKLINVRPMRTHNWSGLGTLIKNNIMFADRPSSYHPDSCADLATLYELPQIKNKTCLNILVMLTPLFHGIGPHHFNTKYLWAYKGILAGFDPVAVDAVGAKIIQAKRKQHFGEEKPINPPPKHIQLADTRHGLGIADPTKIELVKLGWKENILI